MHSFPSDFTPSNVMKSSLVSLRKTIVTQFTKPDVSFISVDVSLYCSKQIDVIQKELNDLGFGVSLKVNSLGNKILDVTIK